MQNQIQQHQGLSLFKSLTSDMRELSTKKIEQQENLMQCLEAWWDHNTFVASYLMARLLPEAAKVIDNHSLCNAIELYLTSGKTLEVSRALNILLKEDLAPFYRKQYQYYVDCFHQE